MRRNCVVAVVVAVLVSAGVALADPHSDSALKGAAFLAMAPGYALVALTLGDLPFYDPLTTTLGGLANFTVYFLILVLGHWAYVRFRRKLSASRSHVSNR